MLKCASFFAGVGGIDKGFEHNELFEVVYANEFDPYPVKTYELNSKLKVDCRDIREVQPDEIPDFDVMLAGFPCQAFSVAGYRKGFDDEKGRGTLFFELVRIIEKKEPEIVFLENVKNLVGHDNGKTFRVINECLDQNGYKVYPMVLNAMEYGNIPQNRERIYLVCFKDERVYQNFRPLMPIPLKKKLSDIIDFKTKVDDKYYYTEGKYKGDIYEQLVAAMDDENAVYQWRRKYVRKNKSGVVPTLTANQGEGGHNVCFPSDCVIDAYDLCTIFSNVLSNALEATVESDDKWISVECRYTENNIIVMVKNTFDSNNQLRNGKTKTHKKDVNNHGFGLENVKDSIKKYNGMWDIDIEENVYAMQQTKLPG